MKATFTVTSHEALVGKGLAIHEVDAWLNTHDEDPEDSFMILDERDGEPACAHPFGLAGGAAACDCGRPACPSTRECALLALVMLGPRALLFPARDETCPHDVFLVGPDLSARGQWRVTRFEGVEPCGHSTRQTFEKVLRAAVDAGADVLRAAAVTAVDVDAMRQALRVVS